MTSHEQAAPGHASNSLSVHIKGSADQSLLPILAALHAPRLYVHEWLITQCWYETHWCNIGLCTCYTTWLRWVF